MTLTSLWCQRHTHREAVVKCPRCHHYFCHECVVEHNDQYLCQDCLIKTTSTPSLRSYWKSWWGLGFGFIIGAFVMICVFYGIGKLLINIPVTYHQGVFW